MRNASGAPLDEREPRPRPFGRLTWDGILSGVTHGISLVTARVLHDRRKNLRARWLRTLTAAGRRATPVHVPEHRGLEKQPLERPPLLTLRCPSVWQSIVPTATESERTVSGSAQSAQKCTASSTRPVSELRMSNARISLRCNFVVAAGLTVVPGDAVQLASSWDFPEVSVTYNS